MISSDDCPFRTVDALDGQGFDYGDAIDQKVRSNCPASALIYAVRDEDSVAGRGRVYGVLDVRSGSVPTGIRRDWIGAGDADVSNNGVSVHE